jgi:hypothetical protein
MKYRLTRVVTQFECPWLVRDLSIGEELYRYGGYTYGCITPSGVACSFDGEPPFFEVPENALAAIPEREHSVDVAHDQMKFASKSEERRYKALTSK